MEQPHSHYAQTVLTPASTGTIYASPAPSHHRILPPKRHREIDDDEYDVVGYDRDGRSLSTGLSDTASPTGNDSLRKKQKRNKPTLSCYECVERKTKVSISPSFIFSLLCLKV